MVKSGATFEQQILIYVKVSDLNMQKRVYPHATIFGLEWMQEE